MLWLVALLPAICCAQLSDWNYNAVRQRGRGRSHGGDSQNLPAKRHDIEQMLGIDRRDTGINDDSQPQPTEPPRALSGNNRRKPQLKNLNIKENRPSDFPPPLGHRNISAADAAELQRGQNRYAAGYGYSAGQYYRPNHHYRPQHPYYQQQQHKTAAPTTTTTQPPVTTQPPTTTQPPVTTMTPVTTTQTPGTTPITVTTIDPITGSTTTFSPTTVHPTYPPRPGPYTNHTSNGTYHNTYLNVAPHILVSPQFVLPALPQDYYHGSHHHHQDPYPYYDY